METIERRLTTQLLIKSEALSTPITRSTQSLNLICDGSTIPEKKKSTNYNSSLTINVYKNCEFYLLMKALLLK